MIAKPKSALIPAATYIRMSSDKQEASPGQQRDECAKLAGQHGCRIVHEYFDEAVSGAETTKRKGFVKMIEDARAGKFKAILCWDQDRFGRFDMIEAGEWISPLRRAGVRLITVAQGAIDWTSFAGRVVYSIQQEGKNQYLVDLSRNVLRGQAAKAKRGDFQGAPPYGYDRMFYNERGEPVLRARSGDHASKPKSWTARLVLSDDPVKVGTVRMIFEKTAAGVRALVIVRELNARKIPPPRGTRWNASTLQTIIKNRVYLGEYHFGMRTAGRYHSIDSTGDVCARLPAHKRAAPVIVPGAHEAIVPAAIFDQAVSKREARATGVSYVRTSGYMLTGLLACGNCGERMTGTVTKHGATGNRWTYYRCNGVMCGTTDCQSANVRTSMIDELASSIICKTFLSPKAIADLRAAIKRQAEKRAARTGPSAGTLTQRIEVLDRQILKGQRNLLLADPEDVPAAKQILDEWRRDRMAMQGQLNALRGPRAVSKSADEIVKRATAMAADLHAALKRADQAAVRAVVHQFFSRVTIYSRLGTKCRYVCRAVFDVRPVLDGQATKPIIIDRDEPQRAYVAIYEEVLRLYRRTGEAVRPSDVANSLGIGISKSQYDVRRAWRAGLLKLVSTGRIFPRANS